MQDRDADEGERAALNAFLAGAIHQVQGWCRPQGWQPLWPLAQAIGHGPICEIGVHEGKFFIPLAKTFGVGGAAADGGHGGVAIDLFEQQEFNLDKSGRGDRTVFEENLDRHGVGAARIECLAVDSLTLTDRIAEDLVRRHGQFVVFSVDGCHEVVHTVNDIEFAFKVTAPNGLIAVDDFLNPAWPGVVEAVSKMYLLREFPFVPLYFSCNKLILCSYAYHARYLDLVRGYLAAHHPTTKVKQVKRYGFDTLTVLPDFNLWTDLV